MNDIPPIFKISKDRYFIMIRKSSGNLIKTFSTKSNISKVCFSRFPLIFLGTTKIKTDDVTNWHCPKKTIRIWFITKKEHNSLVEEINQCIFENTLIDAI